MGLGGCQLCMEEYPEECHNVLTFDRGPMVYCMRCIYCVFSETVYECWHTVAIMGDQYMVVTEYDLRQCIRRWPRLKIHGAQKI